MAAATHTVIRKAQTVLERSEELFKDEIFEVMTLNANVYALTTGITKIEDVQCTPTDNTGVWTSFTCAIDGTTLGNVNITALGATGNCTFRVHIWGV